MFLPSVKKFQRDGFGLSEIRSQKVHLIGIYMHMLLLQGMVEFINF